MGWSDFEALDSSAPLLANKPNAARGNTLVRGVATQVHARAVFAGHIVSIQRWGRIGVPAVSCHVARRVTIFEHRAWIRCTNNPSSVRSNTLLRRVAALVFAAPVFARPIVAISNGGRVCRPTFSRRGTLRKACFDGRPRGLVTHEPRTRSENTLLRCVAPQVFANPFFAGPVVTVRGRW